MPFQDNINQLKTHYAGNDLLNKLKSILENRLNINADELYALDQIHIGGKRFAEDLANRSSFKENEQVLDIGCGIGGPSRMLAGRFNCRVTSLDIVKSYTQTTHWLNRKSGLSAKIKTLCADSTGLPFADASFDAIWCQHVTMNMPDKNQFLKECCRALRKGGRLILHEVFAGELAVRHFPLPWASDISMSFLSSMDSFKNTIKAYPFEIQFWNDVSERSQQWYLQRRKTAGKKSPNPLNMELIFGPQFRKMAGNVVRNFQEQRISVAEALLIKTSD